MDLVAASRDANTLTIFTNNGSGGFVLSFCTARGRQALVGGVGLPVTLTDPMGGNRNRFYRILLSP